MTRRPVVVTCACGAEFETTANRIAAGRGKFCSLACKRAYATRRSGLTYDIVKVNSAWIRPGQEPWNKGLAVKDEISYRELHRWVARCKAKTGSCAKCGAEGETFWANISHEYRRDLADFEEMCRACHRHFDSGENWGKATAKFGRAAVQEG